MKLLALTKPAKFFGLFFDNSRLSLNVANNLIDTDTNIRQRLATGKYHLQPFKIRQPHKGGHQAAKNPCAIPFPVYHVSYVPSSQSQDSQFRSQHL